MGMAWEQEAFVRSLSSLSPNTVDAYRRDVRDFVVWGMEPTGSLDQEKVEWLMGVLSKPTTKAGHALAREITRNPLWCR